MPLSAISTSTEVHPSVHSLGKRLIDLLIGIVGLTITAMIAIPIGILIKLDSHGSIFYSQIRCGIDGQLFRMWKFRTMVNNAEKIQHLVVNEARGQIFKNQKDPRITKLGAFLRRTSIDEFPQFWNVIKGEMSIVGTRPPTPQEVSQYQEHHWQRLKVKPGLTGQWQVYGRSSIKDFEDIVRMDIQYQENWSIEYDLMLIFKTIKILLSRQGAC